jgi:F420-0:gamma-glutamyl ligase
VLHHLQPASHAAEYRLGPDEKAKIAPAAIPEIHNEADLYRALDLDFIEPELREDRGEIAAAAELVMGKIDRIPVAIVRGMHYRAVEASAQALIRPANRDLFR